MAHISKRFCDALDIDLAIHFILMTNKFGGHYISGFIFIKLMDFQFHNAIDFEIIFYFETHFYKAFIFQQHFIL